jgi:alkylhydroperoxidase family enzyme
LSDKQIQDLDRYQQSDAYTEQEKLVLRFAEEWTRQTKASAEVVQALGKSLSESQMVVLAATVALANWTNKFNESFGVELP